MKKKILKIALAALFITGGTATTASLVSCGSSDEIEKVYNANITSSGNILINGLNGSITVSSETESFNFESCITVSDGAEYVVSKTQDYAETSYTQSIVSGDNIFYLKVTSYDKKTTNEYTINVHRQMIYTISFDTAGGSLIDSVEVTENTILDTTLYSTEKEGYCFECFTLADGTVIPEDYKVTGNIVLKAVWVPSSNTPYSVYHYFEDVDGTYLDTPDQIDNLSGTTESLTSAVSYPATGFEASAIVQAPIAADGSTVIKIYYKRVIHSVTVNLDEHLSAVYKVEGEEVTDLSKVRYGASVTINIIPDAGYIYDGMIAQDGTKITDSEYTFTMPVSNVTFTCSSEAADTAYTVNYYYQNIENDEYTKQDSETTVLYGKTDAYTAVSPEKKTGFTLNDFEQSLINADGSTVINIYYTRNKYSLALNNSDHFQFSSNIENLDEIKYGTTVTLSVTSDKGYNFKNIYDSSDNIVSTKTSYEFTMPAENMALFVSGEAGISNYSIEYYFQNIEDDEYTLDTTLSHIASGITDTVIEIEAPEKTGFQVQELAEQKISGDGTTVVKVYYDRIQYTVSTSATLEDAGTLTDLSGTYKYGTVLHLSYQADDYHNFEGWYNGESLITTSGTYDYKVAANVDLEARVSTVASSYRVEYYLQNLEDDEYTLNTGSTSTCEANAGTTTEAVLKEFTGFTYEKGFEQTTVGKEQTVIEIYYTRNVYTVSVGTAEYCTVTGTGTYRYGAKVTVTAKPYVGYLINGSSESSISINSINMDKEYSFTATARDELSGFKFNSSATTCDVYGYNDMMITSLTIPSFVTSISSSAFKDYTKLTTVVIPTSVTLIGCGAFKDCTSLTSITLPFIGASASDYQYLGFIFGGTSYSSNPDVVPTSLKTIEIEEGCKTIYGYAFYNCSSITTVTLPSSLTTIEACAFYGCSGLTSVTFKNTSGWKKYMSSITDASVAIDVSDPETNATNLSTLDYTSPYKRS